MDFADLPLMLPATTLTQQRTGCGVASGVLGIGRNEGLEWGAVYRTDRDETAMDGALCIRSPAPPWLRACTVALLALNRWCHWGAEHATIVLPSHA